MRFYELLDTFGQVITRCDGQELHDSHTLDTDTLYELGNMKPSQTIDLPGYEGAVMVRRVS